MDASALSIGRTCPSPGATRCSQLEDRRTNGTVCCTLLGPARTATLLFSRVPLIRASTKSPRPLKRLSLVTCLRAVGSWMHVVAACCSCTRVGGSVWQAHHGTEDSPTRYCGSVTMREAGLTTQMRTALVRGCVPGMHVCPVCNAHARARQATASASAVAVLRRHRLLRFTTRDSVGCSTSCLPHHRGHRTKRDLCHSGHKPAPRKKPWRLTRGAGLGWGQGARRS